MVALGLRNNNPCNIRYNSANKWKGQTGQSNGFCKFSSMDYGVRAVLSLLRMYRYHYGLDTIRKIITRFAPSSENDTESYIDYVVLSCNSYGFDLDDNTSLNLDFFDYHAVSPLYYIVRSICHVESQYILSLEQFSRCLKMLHV